MVTARSTGLSPAQQIRVHAVTAASASAAAILAGDDGQDGAVRVLHAAALYETYIASGELPASARPALQPGEYPPLQLAGDTGEMTT
jgi:hypothetical protein